MSKKLRLDRKCNNKRGTGVDRTVDAIIQVDDHTSVATGIPVSASQTQQGSGCAPTSDEMPMASGNVDVHGPPCLGVKHDKRRKVKPRGSSNIMFHNVNSFTDAIKQFYMSDPICEGGRELRDLYPLRC